METEEVKKLVEEVGNFLALHTPKGRRQFSSGSTWTKHVNISLDNLHRLHYQVCNPVKPPSQE